MSASILQHSKQIASCGLPLVPPLPGGFRTPQHPASCSLHSACNLGYCPEGAVSVYVWQFDGCVLPCNACLGLVTCLSATRRFLLFCSIHINGLSSARIRPRLHPFPCIYLAVHVPVWSAARLMVLFFCKAVIKTFRSCQTCCISICLQEYKQSIRPGTCCCLVDGLAGISPFGQQSQFWLCSTSWLFHPAPGMTQMM